MTQQKKVIPVKYFYYGMLITAMLICGTFFFLWQKESKEEKLLNEKGITTTAWVTNLYASKVSRKASPNYYMEVAFFHDTSSNVSSIHSDTTISTGTGDGIVAAIAKNAAQLTSPLGKLETQKIALPTYDVYKRYSINDTVKIVFLKEDPSVIRLAKN